MYIPPTLYNLSKWQGRYLRTLDQASSMNNATASLQFPTDLLYLRQIYGTLPLTKVTTTRLKATQPLAPPHLEDRGTVIFRNVSAVWTVLLWERQISKHERRMAVSCRLSTMPQLLRLAVNYRLAITPQLLRLAVSCRLSTMPQLLRLAVNYRLAITPQLLRLAVNYRLAITPQLLRLEVSYRLAIMPQLLHLAVRCR